MYRATRYVVIALAWAWLLAGCTAEVNPTPAPSSTPAPMLGDSRQRPADGAAMIYVPGGSFQMGSDRSQASAARQLCRDYSGDLALATCQPAVYNNEMPAHRVTLDGFWLDRTEVTNGQYRQCLAEGACSPPADLGSYTREGYFEDETYAGYPVVWVSWQQAADYCAWAGARLPTEAEWEYAARGPDGRIFPWGDDFDGRRLNYCDANCPTGVSDPGVDDGYGDTAPVGSYPDGAGWNGALDMAGNVREWVADWYGLYGPDDQTNPQGPEDGDSHIPRGGSWLDRPDDTRSANRGENEVDYVRHKVGFRCAAGVAPE
ncbi:MAG: formylglycine-generating enzyme family protein [Chloroflexota bacterium]|jgi:formylglycine-generating enzyme required for sulfatase activity